MSQWALEKLQGCNVIKVQGAHGILNYNPFLEDHQYTCHKSMRIFCFPKAHYLHGLLTAQNVGI
jgi:hypothetical protein